MGEAAGKLRTHSFASSDEMKAGETFGQAAERNALKVVLKAQPKALVGLHPISPREVQAHDALVSVNNFSKNEINHCLNSPS